MQKNCAVDTGRKMNVHKNVQIMSCAQGVVFEGRLKGYLILLFTTKMLLLHLLDESNSSFLNKFLRHFLSFPFNGLMQLQLTYNLFLMVTKISIFQCRSGFFSKSRKKINFLLQCNVSFSKSIDQKRLTSNDLRFCIVLLHFIFLLPFTSKLEATNSLCMNKI